jgi:phenylalanine-4-hydroxylase
MQTLLPSRIYAPEDHNTWSELVRRQQKLVAQRLPAAFRIGFTKLDLDPERLPDIEIISKRINALSGWTLANAKNKYLSAEDWFDAFAQKQFPVTDYIRAPHQIEYTPLPDLFHEYFGHLAFFTDPAFARMAHAFGLACRNASPQRIIDISRLWWFSAEFGMLREGGELKALGAGLLSSPGEFKHAFSGNVELKPFTVEEVVQTQSSPHDFHQKYFVLEDLEDIPKLLQEYLAAGK